MTWLLLALVGGLAFANGTNDNCKGVATLVGYGAARPKAALIWAMVTTFFGASIAFWLAGWLLKTFSSSLFDTGAALDPTFFTAVLIGAIGWVLFATRTGLPVSTTHAITGALIGAGMMSMGAASMQWHVLGRAFAVPLILSPLLSLAAVYLTAWPVGFVLARAAGKCVCLTEVSPALAADGSAAMATVERGVSILVDSEQACDTVPTLAGASTSAISNSIHWMSSGMVGFARGWNDAPKIAALGLLAVSGTHGTAISFAVVAIAMAVGGMVAGRRVLQTLAKKVTAMPLTESLTASLVTSALVGLASWNSLPVSTTHVSTGAIVGAGLRRDPRGVRWGTVAEIVLSWIVTLPVAALIAAAAARFMHRI